MNNSYTNKVALVTGGTSGIGKTTAIEFARAGAKVVISGRREKGRRECRRRDRTDSAALRRSSVRTSRKTLMSKQWSTSPSPPTAASTSPSTMPVLSGVVLWNKATEAEYRRIFDINVWGVLNSMRHEIPVMLKTGGGAIVNTSSVAGHVGLAQVSIYIASKHAVEGLTKAVALEFAKQNIRINAVAPGVIATEMLDRFAGKEMRDHLTSIVPVGRIGASEEIAAAVLYLCSDAAKFTTGTSLVVDGGFLAQ